MRPIPWSYSSLSDFVNCPFAFYRKRILKDVKEVQGEAQIYGEQAHTSLELRQKQGTPLPPHLEAHEDFMKKLDKLPGDPQTELKAGLNRAVQPCTFFDKDVWWRGIIDWRKVDVATNYAKIVDYKTGKVHNKFEQLAMFAIHTFAEYPKVKLADVSFYWTTDGSTTRKVWSRDEIPQLWAMFVPDLKQYAQAFKTETWQCRPSGLCKGWCAVKDCTHWSPKRKF